jgi:hypothetical protein
VDGMKRTLAKEFAIARNPSKNGRKRPPTD